MLKHGLSGRHALIRNGFTLIELVVVIVILGILSASATAKYMSLQSDARIAVLKNMQGNIKSANSMVLAKALINNAHTGFSDTEQGISGAQWESQVGGCAKNNCVNVGDTWVYLKYAYVDRNSVAFILNADISGLKTRETTNSATNQTIRVPDRLTTLGGVNYWCKNAGKAKCEGYDFCQCRGKVTDKKNEERDSEFIIPKGFPYDTSNHTGGGCYFAYSSAEYNKKDKTVNPPIYTLKTGGC
ncbi:MAG: prepilin-type N-terminal cleavage/methylation domain-containing protein [Succinimonas sp.]|nr:prepilin-type N-terminal cleavage/methylation domain-containing protein [Succinimonas sp.]